MIVKKMMIVTTIFVFVYTFINLEPEKQLKAKTLYLEKTLQISIKKIFNINIDRWSTNGYGYEESSKRDRMTILYFYKKRDKVCNKFDKILASREFKEKFKYYFKVEIDVLNSREEVLIAKKHNIKKYPAILIGSFNEGFNRVPILDSNNNLDKEIFLDRLLKFKNTQIKVVK